MKKYKCKCGTEMCHGVSVCSECMNMQYKKNNSLDKVSIYDAIDFFGAVEILNTFEVDELVTYIKNRYGLVCREE